MSVGDIRIYRGAVTDYWGWEVSMDMTARLALALAVLAEAEACALVDDLP